MTKSMENDEKITVYKIVRNVSFYSMTHQKEMKSAGMKDSIFTLPRVIEKNIKSSFITITHIVKLKTNLMI